MSDLEIFNAHRLLLIDVIFRKDEVAQLLHVSPISILFFQLNCFWLLDIKLESIYRFFLFASLGWCYFNFLFSQTLDVMLQILDVFPKVEPLRCKVWIWFILLVSLILTFWLICQLLLSRSHHLFIEWWKL